jgi:hypothetical protein
MITYKATIVNDDPNKATDPVTRGYGPRVFEHERLDLVEHWRDHVLMELPDAYVSIVKLTEEPVTFE